MGFFFKACTYLSLYANADHHIFHQYLSAWSSGQYLPGQPK